MTVFDLRGMQPSTVRPAEFVPATFVGGDLAFLQYTSGSTGDPKGVAVSHANLIDNSERIRMAMGTSESSSVLIGLPLFHDMGLVGGVMQSMYVGCATTFIPPSELVQYPERWLRLISSLRITTSGGPNFMYELAADEVRDEDVQGLDLSSWQVAFCGAEPIRATTISRFTRRYAKAGFSPGAFFPCYGMAEATLFIAGERLGQAPEVVQRDGVDVVCCGEPGSGMRVRIVDPCSCRALPSGEIGEIWVHGNSVTQGYWMREVLTEQIFHARVQGEDDVAYLRTGDLGWLHEGRLFVSGRLKDLIIVNGRKYAPHDVEEIVERACKAVRRGGVVAFGTNTAGAADRVIVVAELERKWLRHESEWALLASAARAAVSAAYGLSVADMVFVKPGALPRTSSGKLRRTQCRSDYLDGRLQCATTELST